MQRRHGAVADVRCARGQGQAACVPIHFDVADPGAAGEISSSRHQLIGFPTVQGVAVAVYCTALQEALLGAGGVVAHQLLGIVLQGISRRASKNTAETLPVATSRLIIFSGALNAFAGENGCQCPQLVASNAVQLVAPAKLIATIIPVLVRTSPTRAVDLVSVGFHQVARWTSKRIASACLCATDVGRASLAVSVRAEQFMCVWPVKIRWRASVSVASPALGAALVVIDPPRGTSDIGAEQLKAVVSQSIGCWANMGIASCLRFAAKVPVCIGRACPPFAIDQLRLLLLDVATWAMVTATLA
mmetsp:Transcript_155248/g.282267  ORF Transcript_155248/g.282267 Transcript_155248/m.282267 type:complete len:302 (-) Transcript_155248:485-1390(-)